MTADNDDIWQRRYRDLERQIEHLLINVAASMKALEKDKPQVSKPPVSENGTRPKILKVVKVGHAESPYVYCVANGANMEYRFEFFSNKQVVQDTGYIRLNSSIINRENTGITDSCRVTVKADFNRKRHEIKAYSDIKWDADEL